MNEQNAKQNFIERLDEDKANTLPTVKRNWALDIKREAQNLKSLSWSVICQKHPYKAGLSCQVSNINPFVLCVLHFVQCFE